MIDSVFEIVITVVVLPLLAWGVKKLMQWADSKIALNQDERLRKALLAASAELESAVNLAVTEVGEIFVKELKKEGNFNSENAKTAASMAVSKTKEIMSEAGLQVLEDAKVNVKAYIDAVIEENVALNKGE